MPVFEVELSDGRIVELESDTQPDEQSILSAIGSPSVSEIRDAPPATIPEGMQSPGYQNALAGVMQRAEDRFAPAPQPTGFGPDLGLDMRPKRRELDQQMAAAREEEVPYGLRLGAAAHSGIMKGQQLPSTLVRGAMVLGAKMPGTIIANEIGDVLSKAILPPDLQNFRNQVVEEMSTGRDYFRKLGEFERGLSERDAMLGEPDFGTQLAEGTGRAFAELPLQMMSGTAGGGSVAGAVRAAATGAGVTSGMQRFGQEMSEGENWVTAAARGGTSGLIDGLTTRAFGATGAESIFAKEGIGGIVNKLKRAMTHGGYEMGEEAAAQVQHELTDYFQKNPNKPILQAIRDVLLAGSVGAILGTSIGAASSLQGGRDARQGQPQVQALPVEEGGSGIFSETQDGVLSPDEQSRQKELDDKFFLGSEMSSEEMSEREALVERAKTAPKVKVTPTEEDQLINEAIQQEGISGKVEFVSQSEIDEGGSKHPMHGVTARWNPETKKIEINREAFANELARIPAEERAELARNLAFHENVHSHTTEEQAVAFANELSKLEKKINDRIYLGKKDSVSRKAFEEIMAARERGKGVITEEADLHRLTGYEVIRRRLQRMEGMTVDEVLSASGREKWTLKSLVMLDAIIANVRRVTPSGSRQHAILKDIQGKIGVARQAIESGAVPPEEDREGELPIASPRRMTADEVAAAPRGDESVSAEVIESMPNEELTKLFTARDAKGPVYSPQYGSVLWGTKQPASAIPKLEAMRDAARDRMTKAFESGDNAAFMADQGRMLWYSGALEGVRREGGNFTSAIEHSFNVKFDGKVGNRLQFTIQDAGPANRAQFTVPQTATDTEIAQKKEQTVKRFAGELPIGSPRRSEESPVDLVSRSGPRKGDVIHISKSPHNNYWYAEHRKKYGEDGRVSIGNSKAFNSKAEAIRSAQGEGDIQVGTEGGETYTHEAIGDDTFTPGMPITDYESAHDEGGQFPASPRRGMTKAEERRIAEQRKIRELQIAQQEGAAQPAAEAMSERMADEPTTPDAVQSIAQEVLASKVPSFADFMSMLRTRQGPAVQSGQVAEQWADAVWNKLQNATGAELETMVNNLGLRREVFGKIRQGSKTYGLPEGPPDVLTRSGTISDAGVDVGGPESARAKAMERSIRLTKKADVLARQADKTGSLEMKQKADILRRTADNLAAAAQTGEGMPAQQTSLFGGEEAARPADYRDPVRGTQRKARERAISAIGRKLLQGRPSLRYGLNRKSIGPEDVRWSQTGELEGKFDLKRVTEEDLLDLDQLGYELTTGAGTDASTQRIAGGGRYKIKEDALPRSATKRVVALFDTRTKQVHLVSAYRDGRRGPVFLDPSSVTGEHRTLQQMRRYRPLFSIPLDTPVQNFKETFKSAKDFSDRFLTNIQKHAVRIGWRGMESEPDIEGTEGVEGEGGLFMGPEADLARAEQGMVAGARESGADITPQEGRAVYRRFGPLESRADVAKVMADLRNKAQKNQLNANDWLVIQAMSKVNESLLDLYKGEGNLTDQQIADLALQELYDVSQRIQTEGSALTPQQRQSLQGRGLPAEAGAPEAPSPTSRELTMLSRRAPTDISMAEPGSPEVPTGADPNRPAGLMSERDPRQRTRTRRGETTDYSGIAPTPLQALKRTVLRKGNLLDYTQQKRPEGGSQIETGGRVAELTPMAETPGPRESYVSAPRKVEITREVNQIADRISEQPTAAPEPPTPQQGELPIGSLRRKTPTKSEVRESFYNNLGRMTPDEMEAFFNRYIEILDSKFPAALAFKKVADKLGKKYSDLAPEDWRGQAVYVVADVLAERHNSKLRESAEQEGIGADLDDLADQLIENGVDPSITYNQGELPIGSLRRQPGRTVGEKISNVLTDFGSIYDKWMVDRLDEYGGPVTKGAVRDFRGIIDRQKELYGQLTPLLDRARRLSGGVETNRGTDLRSTLKDVPRQVGESARAMRAATWMGGLRKINGKTATAKSVDAIEGKIHVPTYARNLVSVAQAANLEIGRLLQAVVPGFVATGKWQRNLTGLGYDIIRMGGGPLWDAWTEGVALANNRRGHVASTFGVRQHFKKMKEVLDDPMATAEQIEHVNQEMARLYPEVVTHVKHLGAWQEVVHSNLFNYLEQTAQRATHVRAFRERFPNTEAGRRDFRVLNEAMRQELPPEVQRDLDGLIRAMNGHPTDEYGGSWQDFLRLGPQQAGGTAMRVLNQTLNNVLSRLALTGQMFVQPGEVLFGSTPVKLGYKNYLKAMARVRTLYNEMELFGSVNRVMHDYTFQPNSPVRSLFRMAGNVVSKVSMQAMLNELQEASAAATARVVTENIVNGRLSKWEQRMLPQTFKEMGFNPAEVQAMMRGDQTLLSQFQRRAASFLTGGNKAIAEGSRLGANRLFNSVFRFQNYPMQKMNQARNTLTTFVDAVRAASATLDLDENQMGRVLRGQVDSSQQTPFKDLDTASRHLTRFFFGNAMQGAFTVALTALAYGGMSGLRIRKEEAEDEKFKFLTEAFLSSMSGPFYIMWRGARNKGWKGVGEQALRAAFPYSVMNDLTDLADGVGQYRDKDTFDKIGSFLANKTPATKAIGTGMAMFGLGNESQPLDQALNAFYRWRRDEMGFKEESRHLKDDERAEFRTHVKAAIEAMRDGDSEKYVDEWLKAVDARDADSFRDSMRARKVLEDVDGRPLSEELKEKLQNRIGMEAYERLDRYDLMLDQAAYGAIPVQ